MLGRSVGTFTIQNLQKQEWLSSVVLEESVYGEMVYRRPCISTDYNEQLIEEKRTHWELFDFRTYHGVRNVGGKEWLSCGIINWLDGEDTAPVHTFVGIARHPLNDESMQWTIKETDEYYSIYNGFEKAWLCPGQQPETQATVSYGDPAQDTHLRWQLDKVAGPNMGKRTSLNYMDNGMLHEIS